MYWLNNYFIKIIFFLISWFFAFYWIFSIFIFLYKKSQYTIFTRIIQRFWKRSLYLFWLIEVFLFLIYLFLTLISPQEVLFMLDYNPLFYTYINNLKLFFKNLFIILIIILLMNLLILNFKYNTIHFYISFILLILLLIILQEDFYQFYYINQSYNNLKWTFQEKENMWELENDVLKLRPYIHYLYVLIFLKLWHTVFIVGFFLFFENITLYTKKLSFNILAANLQNFYFLFFFGFILKIYLIKLYMNYLYEYIYYWFFLNYHFFDYNYLLYIFNIKYILYILCDFNLWN